MTHEDMCYTPKELLESSESYRQKPREHVWDNGGRNKKRSQAKRTDVGSLKRDSALKVVAQVVRKDSNSLTGWLAKTWTKRWFPVSELETLHLPRFNAEEGNQGLRELDC